MLNRSASLAMSTSVLKALPGKLDIKRHSPGILYLVIAVFHYKGRTCLSRSNWIQGAPVFLRKPIYTCAFSVEKGSGPPVRHPLDPLMLI